MRRFLIRLGCFVGLAAAWMGGQYLINRSFHSRLELPEVHTVIIGDSHGMTAVNPTLFPGSANLCEGAENYLFTFYKLQKVVSSNPNIRRVCLEFNTNNFSTYQDEKLRGDRSKSHFSRYFPTLPTDLYKRVEINEVKFLNSGIRRMLLYPDPEKTYRGRYRKGKPTLAKANVKETLAHHYGTSEDPFSISELQTQYLDSIVQLVKRQGLELILFSTPQHPAYRAGIPETFTTHMELLGNELVDSGVQWIRADHLILTDEEYKDYDHISEAGAEKFTKILQQGLSQKKAAQAAF